MPKNCVHSATFELSASVWAQRFKFDRINDALSLPRL
jgi:hypothetical protein